MANLTSTPVASCTCAAGCPQCMPHLYLTKSRTPSLAPRNVALVAMRQAKPASAMPWNVACAYDPAAVARRPGSKAASCVAYYEQGATPSAMLAAMPQSIRSYGKACLLWDYQHGKLTPVP